MKYKLGFGPMSDLIVDLLLNYSRQYQQPLMIIASRNQVDADSGYVMQTRELANQFNRNFSEYAMLCRDHCGPYFLDAERTLSESAALEATKKTIADDIENDFKLIHIDTSRCQNPYKSADELINFCLKINPNIWFEFGTEENVGVTAALEKYRADVKYAQQFPNIKFVVAQTGSLTLEDKQVGKFDLEVVKQLVECADQNSICLKEHNADYLTADQITLRKTVGVHALNIAPQLGVIQTRTVLKLAEYYAVKSSAFQETVLNSKKWAKWMSGDDSRLKIEVAGHYCFRSEEYKRLYDQLSELCNVKLVVENAIFSCLDQYYKNF
jgi:tagatose-1,6-bisphosphate aldolase non-catalytic subunit AgaZ/GatZ